MAAMADERVAESDFENLRMVLTKSARDWATGSLSSVCSHSFRQYLINLYGRETNLDVLNRLSL